MSNKILEAVKVNQAIVNDQSFSSETATSIGFDMANYDRILFFVTQGAITSTPSWAITAYQGTDTAIGGSQAITGASTTTAPASAGTAVLEVRADALDMANYPTYKYVGIKIVTTGGTSTDMNAVAIRFPSRYKQTTMPS